MNAEVKFDKAQSYLVKIILVCNQKKSGLKIIKECQPPSDVKVVKDNSRKEENQQITPAITTTTTTKMIKEENKEALELSDGFI